MIRVLAADPAAPPAATWRVLLLSRAGCRVESRHASRAAARRALRCRDAKQTPAPIRTEAA